MSGTLPARLLTETITVEPYAGIGPAGPLFSVPVTVRAQVQHTSTLATSSTSASRPGAVGSEPTISTTYRVWIRLGLTVPRGSRLTIRGDRCTATKVNINDGRTLPVPSHIDITAELVGFLATTSVTITRGTPTVDEYGDLVDATVSTATAVPAAISEASQDSSEPVSERGGIVETYTVRFAAGVDVREGDRLTDDRTGTVYRVLDVTYPHTATGPDLGSDDVRVVCRRVAATSTPDA